MFTKFVIAAAAVVMPTSALAQNVAVDTSVLNVERITSVCRAVVDQSLRSEDGKQVIESLDKAMTESGYGAGTRAVVLVACAAYANGRVDGMMSAKAF